MNTNTPYLLFFLLFISTLKAQNIQVDDTYTPSQLVQDVLINSSCATATNITAGSAAFLDGSHSFGYFSGNGSIFPFQNGVILSTGKAVSAEGPNTSILDDGGDISWNGDTDLEQALSLNNSTNATVLEFDFTSYTNFISFDYMLASEEYHDTAPCKYSDGFAFLLKEANTTNPYQNLAVIPGTAVPVKVTSVHPDIPGACGPENEEYFDAFNGTNYPTNFNGQTKVMTAQATVTPGVLYHIKLVIADETNYRYDSAIFLGGGSFGSKTNLGPDRLFATNNPLCFGESFPIDATTTGATAYSWFKNGAPIPGANGSVYSANSDGLYTVEVTINSDCIAEGKIKLEYTAPASAGPFTLLQCDDNNDGITQYNLALAGAIAENSNPDQQATDYFATLQDAQNNTNPIENTQSYTNTSPNQNIYVLLRNRYDCATIATVTLSTSNNVVKNPDVTGKCDDDGIDDGFIAFDLTTLTPEILTSLPAGLQVNYYLTYAGALAFTQPIANPQNFTNTIAGGQTLYARIYNAADCYGIAEVKLEVYYFGKSIAPEEVILCENSIVRLDAGSGFTSYLWSTTPAVATESIIVGNPGTYTVTVTNTQGCTGTKTFTVTLSGRATGATYDVEDFTGAHNSITVYPEGKGDFEFSIDGKNYQDSPVFSGLLTGEYTIYIKDKNGCGPTFKDTVFVLDYPNYFTPNGDGQHETWRIPYMSMRPDIVVTVFDRYGKIMTAFKGASPGWDGTYGGRPMPSTDYWFVIQLENGRKIKGHFSMIR